MLENLYGTYFSVKDIFKGDKVLLATWFCDIIDIGLYSSVLSFFKSFW